MIRQLQPLKKRISVETRGHLTLLAYQLEGAIIAKESPVDCVSAMGLILESWEEYFNLHPEGVDVVGIEVFKKYYI